MKGIVCFLTIIFVLALFGVFVELAAGNFKPYPGPEITAISPAQNGIYNLPNIPLEVNVTTFRYSPSPVQEGIAWLNYSLDGQLEVAANITNLGPGVPGVCHIEMANGILSGMSDGSHTVYIHGNTTFDKYPAIPETSFSLTIYFKVDTVHPTLKVLSPQSEATYTSSNVTLNFTVNEQVGWAGYSIDGEDVITTRLNTTIVGLSYRTHVLRVYANDSAGNECFSPTIAFTVKDIASPVIAVLSETRSYNVSAVPLEFSVDKNVSWLGYSLDGKENVTVTGNFTLTDLQNGLHSLIIYANDTNGNMGVSQTFSFTVAAPKLESDAFPMVPFVVISVVVAVVVAVAAVVYLEKRKSPNVHKAGLEMKS